MLIVIRRRNIAYLDENKLKLDDDLDGSDICAVQNSCCKT